MCWSHLSLAITFICFQWWLCNNSFSNQTRRISNQSMRPYTQRHRLCDYHQCKSWSFIHIQLCCNIANLQWSVCIECHPIIGNQHSALLCCAQHWFIVENWREKFPHSFAGNFLLFYCLLLFLVNFSFSLFPPASTLSLFLFECKNICSCSHSGLIILNESPPSQRWCVLTTIMNCWFNSR